MTAAEAIVYIQKTTVPHAVHIGVDTLWWPRSTRETTAITGDSTSTCGAQPRMTSGRSTKIGRSGPAQSWRTTGPDHRSLNSHEGDRQ